MSLESYLVKGCATCGEIHSDFSPEEIEELYNQLAEIEYSDYLHFVTQNLQDILKYISLSPSRRMQKKWSNHPKALWIRCAALQISSATERLLSDILGITAIVDRGSYRDFHTVFAYGLAPILLGDVFYQFPFDDFDNPFLEKYRNEAGEYEFPD